ncbi:hypothetical protein [Pyrobaculum sp.]|uniref:hypothetical protein n=1 Tax=Pyrobaculum sp. TaxID=2004705 RepID=UPI00316917A3
MSRAKIILMLVLVTASLALAERVYVYEVQSDFELPEGAAPHIPGASWKFGGQALVVYVPRDIGPGIVLFTNETADVRLYDRRYFLLVIPAGIRPSPKAKAEAVLETGDGVIPLVFRGPDRGIVDIAAADLKDAEAILRQLGLEPEYRGKARLKKVDTQERSPEAGSSPFGSVGVQAARPSLGSTLDVYGGIYFRSVTVSKTGRVDIPVHGDVSACPNVPDAANVGYDARYLTLGVLIVGGTVNGELVVDVFKIDVTGCEYLGTRRYFIANKTRYWVDLVNPTNSVSELAVRLYLNVNSYTGRPRVNVSGAVLYTRTYRHGFEIGEFSAKTASASGYLVYNYVRRIVIGPYVAYDGYVANTFSSTLSLDISTDPVNGACKDLSITSYLNGAIYSRSTYKGAYNGLVCVYNVNIPGVSQAGFTFEYSYAKAFGGGLFWVLDVVYADGSTPYIRTIHLKDSDTFRYWRWAEQWKTWPDFVDSIWASPFLSSTFEIYLAPTEPSAAPGIYHGLVTVRPNAAGQTQTRVIVTISGRYIYPGLGSVVYINKAEVYMFVPLPTDGAEVNAEAYLMPGGSLTSITAPKWVEIAQRVKDAIDFILTITGFGGRAAGLLSFVVGQALQSAGDVVRVEQLSYNSLRLVYQRGWGSYVSSDTVIAPLSIPALEGRKVPTEITLTQICLDGFCTTPNLKTYVQPDTGYLKALHTTVKNWMFRGQTQHTDVYR